MEYTSDRSRFVFEQPQRLPPREINLPLPHRFDCRSCCYHLHPKQSSGRLSVLGFSAGVIYTLRVMLPATRRTSGGRCNGGVRATGFSRWSNNGCASGYATLRLQQSSRGGLLPLNTINRQSYRQPSINSDDESDDEGEDEEDEDEDEEGDDDDKDDTDDLPPTTQQPQVHQAEQNDPQEDEGPLEKWGDKCKAKQRIITELKDKQSDIHLFIPDDPTDFKHINYKEIHQCYASRYELSRFKGYMTTILNNYKSGARQFKDDDIEPWTSRSKRSKGWHLLYGLLMNTASKEKLKRMSVDDIHKSEPTFKRYGIKDFEKYYRDMIKLCEKLRKELFQILVSPATYKL